ncbi:MAG: SLC13 family permease [Rhodovibrionaceae bacterium]|nr:SLC13 family permease [Rhodovibrionaceae bacterium]
MTAEQTILFVILATSLGLFAWGRIRYDLVALIALLAAVLLDIVPRDEAFNGFGHPAVITVAAVLVISQAISKSDIVERIAQMLRRSASHPTTHILSLSGLAAVCSAFMNNVGALALILPIALHSARLSGRPASQILMPISFATLLGGLITLIGTPPNIIIASFRESETGQSFGLFDFAPVGLSVAVVGIAFMSLIGWRLLPQDRNTPKENDETRKLFKLEDYITEVTLPKVSPYVGRRLADLETLGQGDIAVVALVRRSDRMLAPSGYMRLQAGDVLILEADASALKRVVEAADLEMVGSAELSEENLRSERVGLMEVVVAPGSRLEGRTARSMRMHTRYGLNLLGVARQGEPITERLGQVRFLPGDVLLLQGERESLPETCSALGCLPLAERELPETGRRGGASMSLFVFAAAILMVVAGIMPPHVAFVGAGLILVLAGEISPREIYESIDFSVIVLLGAMIPVGMALETTGGSEVLTAPILAVSEHVPMWGVLGIMMMVTMLLSDVMNNAATAVLMAPIAMGLAEGLGASQDPFLMGVAVGASSTFLTPIGHQSNLLVMGPGGYRFQDYWRMGLPLDIIILLIAVPMITFVWPF